MRGYSVVQTFQQVNNFVLLEVITSPTESYYIAKAWASIHETVLGFDQNVWIITTPTPSSSCTASPTVSQLDPTDPAAGVTAQGMCSVTTGSPTVVFADSFNWSKGWVYIPNPSERIFVANGLTVGIYLGNPPGQNLTVDCGMILVEVG